MAWGAHPVENGRTQFAIWAPDCAKMILELRGGAGLQMHSREGGWHELETAAPVGTRYRYRLPDGLTVPDPASRAEDGGVHGWSVVTDTAAWSVTSGFKDSADWRGRPWEEAVIYECHAGVLGGFAAMADRLPELVSLGITAVQLMPVAAFAGSRNWGYDGVLPYAPAEALGSPEDLRSLVSRAHELGLMIYLDVVYNHFGPDGNYLGAYASEFFHADAKTPWGAAVAVDREPVARYFIDNALMWLTEYNFDGLRFDAVHAIANDAFLDRMAEELRMRAGDRPVHLILENEANDPERLGGLYDAQWNDDFHNSAHVILTGETDSYYAAFADRPAAHLARALGEGFAYQGEPIAPGRTRGAPSSHLAPTSFVNFLQNHDQVGNRAMGERLTLLTGRDRLEAATALMLLSPGIPMIFMGEEVGSTSPFLFFTDFHDDLADAVREGRRQEFARFPAFSDPAVREKIPDPNAEETFALSTPQPGPDASEWRELYSTLLTIRHSEIVPHLAGTISTAASAVGSAAVSGEWLLGNGAKLRLLANLGTEAIVADPLAGRKLYSCGDPHSGPGCIVMIEAV